MLTNEILPLLLMMGLLVLFAGAAVKYGVDSRERWSTHGWQEPRRWL